MPEPCPYCGDCPPDGECGCIASEDVAALRAQVEDLKAAGRKAADDATSALDLLSRVRFALGDNGTRMQGELLEYCAELRAALVFWAEAHTAKKSTEPADPGAEKPPKG